MGRVLCAFQSEEIFDFVKSTLKTLDFEVIKASSESLALFLAHKNFPCLIVSELQVDSGWGLNLLSDLKAEDQIDSIPLVFLSRRPAGISIPETELPKGAEMLLWYPIEAHEFMAAISKYLRELKDDRLPESPE